MIRSLSRESIAKIAKLVNQLPPSGDARDLYKTQPPEPITFRNVSSETIPEYAVMLVTGAEIADETRHFVQVNKPDGTAGPFLFNSGREVAANALGQAQRGPVVRSRYETADTPATGETWGPESGAWTVTPDGEGAIVIYGQARDTGGRELVVGSSIVAGNSISLKIAKADTTITAGSSGTVSVWENDASADTNENLTAHLDWMHGSENISADKELLIAKFGSMWRIIGAECET